MSKQPGRMIAQKSPVTRCGKALLTREATSAAAHGLWQRDSPTLIFDLPGTGFLNEDR